MLQFGVMHVPSLLAAIMLFLGSKAGAKAKPPVSEFPVVTYPGYEATDGGGSRIFVELTKTVSVVEKKSEKGMEVDYVLKGARILKRNNRNPLVTVHFNTPVERAQLATQGKDVILRIKLRASSTPTWKVVNDDNGQPTLQVDFPSGSYLPAAPLTPPGEDSPSDAKPGE